MVDIFTYDFWPNEYRSVVVYVALPCSPNYFVSEAIHFVCPEFRSPFHLPIAPSPLSTEKFNYFYRLRIRPFDLHFTFNSCGLFSVPPAASINWANRLFSSSYSRIIDSIDFFTAFNSLSYSLALLSTLLFSLCTFYEVEARHISVGANRKIP